MNKKLYPMTFEPIAQERAWGGESWLVSAMGEGRNSIVTNGFLAENDLDDILETYMGELVGDSIFEFYNLQFPLLVKTLDVRENLSVQVHPDDEIAFERFYEFGKCECWYVMETSPDARIYLGFKRETSAGEFYEKCKDGSVDELMNVYRPEPGETFFIPAGTVHACGGGLKIAEIQEPSDITFRLYDWGRENNPATARDMHLEEALDCIDYGPYDDSRFHSRHKGGSTPVADCDRFTVRALDIASPLKVDMDAFDSCAVYLCLKGSVEVAQGGTDACTLRRGEAVLLPAGIDDSLITPGKEGATLLEAHIREIKEKDEYIREGVSAEPEEEKEFNGRYKS
ncbi:MAG: class I mannose-6-phosphate isomerase [Bacteroidales bacterium]|nr:class I mannose-6-phosphate isomerase [Bacteroidales bacterium]